MSKDSTNKPRKSLTPLKLVFVALVVVVICGVSYLVWQHMEIEKARKLMSEAGTPPTTVEAAPDEELPDNPIDFASLWEKNVESYAWLYIPNTEINTPIQQSSTDDAYYLTHNQNREDSITGCAFTQMANKQDFSDPVTVIYGHDNEGIFKNLHYFEDEAFFNDNPELYIYTPGHILTYTIVSAYKYDNRHILNSFNFSNPSTLQQYFDFVSSPDSMLKNVREGVTLDANSKIVQLSTCMLNEYHGPSRWLVSAVLTNDQETK